MLYPIELGVRGIPQFNDLPAADKADVFPRSGADISVCYYKWQTGISAPQSFPTDPAPVLGHRPVTAVEAVSTRERARCRARWSERSRDKRESLFAIR